MLSPVARFRGPSRVPNSEAVRRLLVRLHEFPHSVLANEIPRPPLSMSPGSSVHGSANQRLSKRICCRSFAHTVSEVAPFVPIRKALACTLGPGRLNRLAIAKHDMCQILPTLPQIVRRIQELYRSECDRGLYHPNLVWDSSFASQTWIPADLAEGATTVYAETGTSRWVRLGLELGTPCDLLGHAHQEFLVVSFHFRKEPAQLGEVIGCLTILRGSLLSRIPEEARMVKRQRF
jgi:hypothetical protein